MVRWREWAGGRSGCEAWHVAGRSVGRAWDGRAGRDPGGDGWPGSRLTAWDGDASGFAAEDAVARCGAWVDGRSDVARREVAAGLTGEGGGGRMRDSVAEAAVLGGARGMAARDATRWEVAGQVVRSRTWACGWLLVRGVPVEPRPSNGRVSRARGGGPRCGAGGAGWPRRGSIAAEFRPASNDEHVSTTWLRPNGRRGPSRPRSAPPPATSCSCRIDLVPRETTAFRSATREPVGSRLATGLPGHAEQ